MLGAFFCETANIAGYGAASWNFYLTGAIMSQTSCESTCTATIDFTLPSDDSALVVNESGYVCGPGRDAIGYFAEGPKTYGHPNYPYGTCTVDTPNPSGSGVSGSGTDAHQAAGAHAAGRYTGALG